MPSASKAIPLSLSSQKINVCSFLLPIIVAAACYAIAKFVLSKG